MSQTTEGVPIARLVEAIELHRNVFFGTLAPKTRAEYSCVARQACADLPHVFTSADVTKWHLVTLIASRGYSFVYANWCLSIMRTITRKALAVGGDQDLAACFQRVAPVKDYFRSPRCPPRDLMRAALNCARSPAERLLFQLAGYAGLRIGEILGLRAEDFDRDNGVIRVIRQRKRECRKNRVPHVVRVDNAEMLSDLAWTMAQGPALRARSGWFRGGCDGFLIPWGKKRVDGILGRLRQHLGTGYLPSGAGWHSFRHWGATELARDGASVWDVQAWLGDKDPKMACVYVAMVRGETSACVSRLARISRKITPRVAETTLGAHPSSRSRCHGGGRGRRGKPVENFHDRNKQHQSAPKGRAT